MKHIKTSAIIFIIILLCIIGIGIFIFNHKSIPREINQDVVTEEKITKGNINENPKPTGVVPTNTILKKQYGSIKIITNPTNAKIFINGVEKGVSPCIINKLIPGDYTIESILDGYENARKSVTFKDGREISVDLSLQKKYGNIRITTEPEVANVSINGIGKGKSPCIITNMEPNSYLLEIALDKYEKVNQEINVEYGKDTILNISLKKSTGNLKITTSPSEAMIKVNSKIIGNSPCTIHELAPAVHEVSIELKGYKSIKKSVIVIANKTNEINVSLEKIEPGLIAEWNFNENCGIVTHDLSYNQNVCTIQGATWENGKVGSGLNFDGVNDYVVCDNKELLKNIKEFTITAWVYLKQNPFWSGIITKSKWDNGYKDTAFALKFFSSTGKLNLWATPSGNESGKMDITSNTALKLNSWYHIAVVYKPSMYVKIYINGRLDRNESQSILPSIYSESSQPIRIGYDYNIWANDRGNFPGIIDEIKIYNKTLDADAIRDLYERTK